MSAYSGHPRLSLLLAALLLATLACSRPSSWAEDEVYWMPSVSATPAQSPAVTSTHGQNSALITGFPTARPPGAPILTPTPDTPHILPALRTQVDSYMVQPGDTLGLIARRYGVSIEQIIQENKLPNPDILSVGLVLSIPVPDPQGRGPDTKIIPDSELVNGPAASLFDVKAFVLQQAGFLASYKETIEETAGEAPPSFSGVQIVERVAREYSVNPRLLLAVLQHQSGWVKGPEPDKEANGRSSAEYPLGLQDKQRKGLYRQLAWAANNLNRGYYTWRVSGAATWLLADGSIVPVAPTINAGTAGVQQLFALLYNRSQWEQAVSINGLAATYANLFGYPFDYAIEPLLPVGLAQPPMQLPFEIGKVWAFTGGPHGGWGDGSAWAALDFAPPGEPMGCVVSDDWVAAVADGVIVRAANGAVVQDLDGDGLEQTGWTVLYMHVDTRERVKPGDFVKAGERIGHPSCEGGLSSGTHVHLARRYNGEWIPADQSLPFILDGWVSSGAGKEYDGFLEKGDRKIEADAIRSPENDMLR